MRQKNADFKVWIKDSTEEERAKILEWLSELILLENDDISSISYKPHPVTTTKNDNKGFQLFGELEENDDTFQLRSFNGENDQIFKETFK